MTKTEILKQFFKKFYNVDANGKGTGAVLNDIIKNNETLGSGGSGSGSSSGGGALVIGGFSYDSELGYTGTADKTWQEIDDALAAGVRCVVVFTNTDGHSQKTIMFTVEEEGEYQILDTSNFSAAATSADGYPVAGDSPVG